MDRNKKSTAKTEVGRQYDLNTVGFGVVALFTDPLAFGRWVRCLLCETIFHENFIVSSLFKDLGGFVTAKNMKYQGVLCYPAYRLMNSSS